jgi:hypothetical protein
MIRTLHRSFLLPAVPALLLLACAGPAPAPSLAAPAVFHFERQAVNDAMEDAFDRVDFRFCRDRSCWVEPQDASGQDARAVGDCLTRHLVAARGVPAAGPEGASLKLSYRIDRISLDTAQRIWTPDVQTAEFHGKLRVINGATGALEHEYDLRGMVRRAVLQ